MVYVYSFKVLAFVGGTFMHVLRSACLFPVTAVRLGSEPVKMLALGGSLKGLSSIACLYFCVSVFVT